MRCVNNFPVDGNRNIRMTRLCCDVYCDKKTSSFTLQPTSMPVKLFWLSSTCILCQSFIVIWNLKTFCKNDCAQILIPNLKINLNLIYRIDRDGHLKITDFGFAKKLKDRTWTLCGTPEYLGKNFVKMTSFLEKATITKFSYKLQETTSLIRKFYFSVSF